MLVEEAITYLVEHNFIDTFTIPSSYLDALSGFIDMCARLNFILPVDTFLSCTLFTMSFALACGLVKLLVTR